MDTPASNREGSTLTGSPPNPLFCSVVFQELSKYLSLTDLKNCRLVCKDWRGLSFGAMRKRSQLYFYDQKSLFKFHCQKTELEGLGSVRINVSKNSHLDLTLYFLETMMGDGIRHLGIDCSTVQNPLMSYIADNAANLESITFRFSSSYYNNRVGGKKKGSINALADRMAADKMAAALYTKLKKIEVNQIPMNESQYVWLLLVRSPYLTQINCIDRVMSTWIWDNLECWTNTLQTLSLGYVNFTLCLRNKTGEFPFLPHLKKLTVTYWQELRGLDRLTGLKELRIQRSNLELMFLSFPQPMGVEKLSVDDSFRLGSFPRSILPCFPNLKSLHFPAMSNRALQLICGSLSSLEELVLGGAITDAGITGYLANKKLPKIIEAALNPSQHRDVNLASERKHKFLGNLTRLTHLTITSKKISDVGVLLGLIHCKSLTSLRVERPALTKTSLILLANYLELQNLYFRLNSDNVHDWMTSKEMEYFQDIHPQCNVELFVEPFNYRNQPVAVSLPSPFAREE